MKQYVPIFGLLAVFVSSCSKAPFDEKQTFESTYADPVVLSIPTDRPYVSPSNGINTGCIFAKLIRSGAISYSAEPSQAPWIKVVSKDLPVDENGIQVFIGHRSFYSSENSERFSRGGNDYFAETVTYYVTGSSPLPMPSSKGFGPFQARVVYVRDPAVGEWRADTGIRDDAANVVSRNLSAGDCPKELTDASSRNAYAESMTVIERQLAERGVVARTSDSEVLKSSSGNLAIFKGWITENRLDNVSRENLTQIALNSCAGLNRGGYRWRLPTFNDFYPFTEPYVRDDYRKLADAPDHHIWGNLNEQSPGQYYVLNTNNPSYNLYEAHYANGIFTYDGISFSNKHARILCVADSR
jgi:hypothetical protein